MDMKEPKIRIAYISPDDTELHVIDMEDTLDNWYQILKCTYIEAHVLYPDDSNMLFICDEEGKMKKDPKPNFIWELGNNDVVVGTVGFCRRKGPEFASLTDVDIMDIRTYIKENSYYPMEFRKEFNREKG